jgi:hypothetical protein
MSSDKKTPISSQKAIEEYLQNGPSRSTKAPDIKRNDNLLIASIIQRIEDLEFRYDTTQGINRYKQDGLLIRDMRSTLPISKKTSAELDQIGFQMQMLNEYLTAIIVLDRVEVQPLAARTQELRNKLVSELDNPEFLKKKSDQKSVKQLRQELAKSLSKAGVVDLYDQEAVAPVTGEKTVKQGKYSKALACSSMERDRQYDLVTISEVEHSPKKSLFSKKQLNTPKKTIVEVTERLLPSGVDMQTLAMPKDHIDEKFFNLYKNKFSTHIIPTYMRAMVPSLPRHAFTSKLFTVQGGKLEQISEQSRSAVPAYIPIAGENRTAEEAYEEAKKGTIELIKNLAAQHGHTKDGPPICLNLLYSPTQKNGTHPYAYTTKVLDDALKELKEEGIENIVIAKTPVNPWRFFETKTKEEEKGGIDYTGFDKVLKYVADNLHSGSNNDLEPKAVEAIASYIKGESKDLNNALMSLEACKPDIKEELRNMIECRQWINGDIPLNKPHHELAAKVKSACDATQFGALSRLTTPEYKRNPPKFVSFCMEGKDRTTVSVLYTHAKAFASKFTDFSVSDITSALAKSGHNAMVTTWSIIGAYGQKADSVNLFSSPNSNMKILHKSTAETKWKTKPKSMSFVEKLSSIITGRNGDSRSLH